MKLIILSALLFAGIALGQNSKPATPPAPPTLTEAQKLAYFKANSEYQSALAQVQQIQQTAQQKRDALDKAVKEMTDACGAKFHPTIDANGDPVCIVKPEPPKPAETKK